MDRLGRFAENRWVGDKRTQVVHDIDSCTAPDIVNGLMAAETFICFGPDTLAEARNRGYRRCRNCAGAREAAAREALEAADDETVGTR